MDRVIDVYQRDMISLAVQEEVRHPIEIPRFEDLQTRGRMEAPGPSIVRRQPELSVNRKSLKLINIVYIFMYSYWYGINKNVKIVFRS